jgi:hypothetical protein
MKRNPKRVKEGACNIITKILKREGERVGRIL